MLQLQPGSVVDRYVVQGVIGAGGQATVYRVKHTMLGSMHALKVLNECGEALTSRLVREGQLQARLDPTLVVPVHDIVFVDDAPALLMPLVRGCSLEHVIDDVRLNESEIAYVLYQVALSLKEAHGKRVIHRDLKPANILLESKHGRLSVRVSDFGIAADGTVDEDERGLMLGTIAYSAPEQLEDAGSVDHRADLWSFGCLAYELLVNRRPFQSEEAGQTLLSVLNGTYDLEVVPLSWRPLIAKALTRDLGERWASAAAILDWLERHQGRQLPHPDSPLMAVVTSSLAIPVVSPVNPTQTLHSGEGSGGRLSSQSTTRQPQEVQALPVERNAFIGRDSELSYLGQLQGAQMRLLTILGTGGSGKTRLAMRYVKLHQKDWAGGVFWVDISEVHSLDDLCQALAKRLEIKLSHEDPVGQISGALADRERTLLVLDNAEQAVAPVGKAISQCLARSSEVTFLVTSRIKLNVAAEHVWRLPPLESMEGVALFIDRAQRVKSEFNQTNHLKDIQDLVKQLDQLPLAIELAAARISVMSPAKMLKRIGQRFKLLHTQTRETNRHRTLRAALDWSWALLSEWEQSGLAQLAVFEGGFDLEGAEAVLDLDSFDAAPWAIDAVQSLVDKSLVRPLQDDRFCLLATVQDYASEQMDALGLREQTEFRHMQYFARFGTDESLDSHSRHGGLQRWRLHMLEHDNFVAACDRAIQAKNGSLAIHLASAIHHIVNRVGPSGRSSLLVTRIQDVCSLDDAQLPTVHRIVAQDCLMAGKWAEARESVHEAIATSRAIGDVKNVARSQLQLGIIHYLTDEIDEAQKWYVRAIAVCRSEGFLATEALIVGNLGLLNWRAGNVEEALRQLMQALEMHQRVGNIRAQGREHSNIGVLQIYAGNSLDGAASLREALRINREVQDARAEAITLVSLGVANQLSGDVAQAFECGEAAVQLQRQVSDYHTKGEALLFLADLHCVKGELDSAIRLAEEATEIGERSSPGLFCASVGVLAKSLLGLGRTDEAMTVIQRGESKIDQVGDPVRVARFLLRRAMVYHAAGEMERAAQQLSVAEARVAELRTAAYMLDTDVREARAWLVAS